VSVIGTESNPMSAAVAFVSALLHGPDEPDVATAATLNRLAAEMRATGPTGGELAMATIAHLLLDVAAGVLGRTSEEVWREVCADLSRDN
jgi:hypothetical protein